MAEIRSSFLDAPERASTPRTLPFPTGGLLASQGETIPGFRVVVAGAGIAGLTLALALLRQGIRVMVLERDLTAVRGEGKLRGPIQVR